MFPILKNHDVNERIGRVETIGQNLVFTMDKGHELTDQEITYMIGASSFIPLYRVYNDEKGCYCYQKFAVYSWGTGAARKPETLDEVLKRTIEQHIEYNGGHKGNAAKTLGISRSRLYRLFTKFDMSPHVGQKPLYKTKPATNGQNSSTGEI